MSKPRIDWIAEIKSFAWLGLAFLFVWSAVAKPFYIPSESMLPNLLVGDRLIVTKYPYGYSYLSMVPQILPHMDGRLFGSLPKRGDVVVVKAPNTHEDWIKRVIGLPGDTVQMKEGALWLNGAPVPRTLMPPLDIVETPNSRCDMLPMYRMETPQGAVCRYPRFRETIDGRSFDTLDLGLTEQDDTPPIIVPEGHVFLMGDNRDNSRDSRFAPEVGGLGLLPIENVVGRAEFITFSLDGSSQIFNPISWFTAMRGGRSGTSLHPHSGQ